MNVQRLSSIALALLLLCSATPVFATSVDTDGDGLLDNEEDINQNGIIDNGETDPYNADTDRGGESDGSEVRDGRNPLDPLDDMTADADGDGWVNGIEIQRKTDPKNVDTDNDGINDPEDPFPLDSRYSKDANANQLPDEWEALNKLSDELVTPTRVDDPDQDGLNNAQEFAQGTNPLSADTDRDGIDDKTEIDEGGDPKENACLSYEETDTPFADLSSHWSQTRVQQLRDISILPDLVPLLRGYDQAGKTLFKPDQAVTRYEFVKMVLLSTCTKLWNTPKQGKPTFSDVISTAPTNENSDTTQKRRIIYSAVRYDIIQGYEDGTFRPDAEVNRAEALKILTLAARTDTFTNTDGITPVTFSDVLEADWFAPYVTLASTLGIVGGYPDGSFGPSKSITRAEAAKIIYETIRRNPVINGYILPE